MTFKTPLWQQNSTYSATLDRELVDTLFSVPGTILTGDLLVSQRAAGANMSVDVAVGSCVVTGTSIAGQGKYLCKSDAIVNVTIATAPGTGQSRIDLIVATVRDVDQDGGSHNDWLVQAVTGTAAATGSQVAPSVPASSLLLAQIAVGPNVTTIVTANITDKRVSAAASGDPAWNTVSFANSWVNFGAPYANASYRKVGERVFLRGCIKSGTMSAAAFVLPVGYRPSSTRVFAVASNAGTFGEVSIDSSGNVDPIAGTNAAMWVDGIVFDTLT